MAILIFYICLLFFVDRLSVGCVLVYLSQIFYLLIFCYYSAILSNVGLFLFLFFNVYLYIFQRLPSDSITIS